MDIKSVNFFVNSVDLARSLGKKGTESDISIFNHKSSSGIFTYACPNSDNIGSILCAMGIGDMGLIRVSGLNTALGETIIGLEYCGLTNGFVLLEGTTEEEFIRVAGNTVLGGYTLCTDIAELNQKILGAEVPGGTAPPLW